MFDFKHAVIYQVWPRSFQDSNGDGIGDIRGLIARLDYLKALGITAIWLCPVYASPNDDYGYDIANYYEINPEYGTMEDLDALIQGCHQRGIQLIMDLVANHTSTQHHWFQSALKDENSPYRDFYFFKKGSSDNPPNNWMSFFGGSAWQKEKEDSYYLTLFAPTQADLNWGNPQVRQEIYAIMRYYLDKGVDGFRMDVINAIDKKEGLPSKNPELPGLQFPGDYVIDGPKVQTYLKEMNQEVIQPYGCLALGEGVAVEVNAAMAYTNPANHELNMTFHFDLAMLGYGDLGKYDPRKLYYFTKRDLKAVNRKWQQAMMEQGGYIGNYLSNHDNKRHLDRFGDIKKYRYESATAYALYNFSLYGTPFVYQGEEIGMTNCKLPYTQWKDYEALNSVQAMKDILGVPLFLDKMIGQTVTRDNARTPFQWTGDLGAGFTTAEPWMMINPNYLDINLENDLSSNPSICRFYQKLIAFRKQSEALCLGTYEELNENHPTIVCFKRTTPEEQLLILVNLDKGKYFIDLEEDLAGEEVLYNSVPRPLTHHMNLEPYEAHIYRIR